MIDLFKLFVEVINSSFQKRLFSSEQRTVPWHNFLWHIFVVCRKLAQNSGRTSYYDKNVITLCNNAMICKRNVNFIHSLILCMMWKYGTENLHQIWRKGGYSVPDTKIINLKLSELRITYLSFQCIKLILPLNININILT